MTEQTPFIKIEPWDSPVDGTVLADSINNLLNKYLSLPDGASETMTMWILHTYGVNLFDFTPRLCILSPEKRCGKTSLLTLLHYLSFQTIIVAGITTAAMFRSIDKWHPTVIIDEIDTFLKENSELRGVINVGYNKNGRVSRTETVGKRVDIKLFDCYAPVAMAGIGSIPGTIADRGIIITMRRKMRCEDIPQIRTRNIIPITEELQRKCLRFMLDNSERIANVKPDIPITFNDRAADIWEPLYAIATAISPEWLERVRSASIKLIRANDLDDEAAPGEKLLSDIKQIFDDKNREWIATTELVGLLNKIENSPWGEWNNGKGLTVHSLPKLLRPFGIVSEQSRVDGSRSRRYNRKQFTDVFSRYLGGDAPLDCATVPSDDGLADMPD